MANPRFSVRVEPWTPVRRAISSDAADTQLLEALLKGEYVFLLDSRQKGKSSMVARTIVSLKDKGVKTVKLDLQRIGANVTPEQWYAGMLAEIGQELGLRSELFEHWGAHQEVGPLARWIGALLEIVLAKSDMPIVIFIDEVDFVRALPFPTDEFFAGIRDCYNRRSEGKGFERLTFCLVGVATPGQLIRNPEITPFNIGTRIDISDFTLRETQGYAVVLDGGGRNGAQLMSRVHHWLNGHPYLTQLLCSHIASDPSVRASHEVDRLVHRLFVSPEARQREPNFADVERRILDPDVPGLSPEEKRTQVLELYGKVLKGKKVVAEENPVVATLRLSGVGLEDKQALRVRNRLYGMVFDEKWRRQSLPDAESRRQRGAARVTLLRTAAVAGVVVLGVTGVALNTNRLAADRQKALRSLQVRSAELGRVSEERQRSLFDVKVRSAELARVSSDRAKALEVVSEKNKALAKISNERQRALSALAARTEELEGKNYLGLMSAIELAIKEERWTRATELISRKDERSRRGWEWGHAALIMGGFTTTLQLGPMRNEFETDENGRLCVVSPEAIYGVSPNRIRLRRKFNGPPANPTNRRDGIRCSIDPETGRYIFRDAFTDRRIGEFKNDGMIMLDWDPETRTAVRVSKGRYERCTFDGKPTGVQPAWAVPNLLSARVLADGGALTIESNGSLCRRDLNGQIVEETNVGKVFGTVGLRLSDDMSVFVLTGSLERGVQVRQTEDLRLVGGLNQRSLMNPTVAISPDNARLAVGNEDGSLRLFEISTGQLIGSYYNHRSPVLRLAFLPDGKHFASIERSGTVRVWPVAYKPTVDVLEGKTDPYRYAFFTENDRFVIGCTQSSAIETINLQAGTRARRSVKGFDLVAASTIIGSKIYMGTPSGHLERVSMEGLKVEQSAKVVDSPVFWTEDLTFGRQMLVAETPAPSGRPWFKFAIVDTESLKVQARFQLKWPNNSGGPQAWIEPDSSLLAFWANERAQAKSFAGASPGGMLHIVSASNGNVVKTIKTHQSIRGAAITPDGKTLLLASHRGMAPRSKVEIIDVASGKQIGRLETPLEEAVDAVRLHQDAKLVSILTVIGKLHLYDLKSRKRIATLSPGERITNYEFGQGRLLTVSVDGIRIWDTKTWLEVFKLTVSGNRVADQLKQAGAGANDTPHFSRNGRDILMACSDGKIRVWHSAEWRS